MATALAPVDSREVVRCDGCRLVQFRTTSNRCRKCRTPYDIQPILEPIPAPRVVNAKPGHPTGVNAGLALLIATNSRILRARVGLSQRQLGERMRVPRTYLTKVERGNMVPTLALLERLAAALNASIADLLQNRTNEIADLVKDEFISQIVPYVQYINAEQRSTLLSELKRSSA